MGVDSLVDIVEATVNKETISLIFYATAEDITH
jgi:hypothetical protein